jgi:cellulose synthase (UDP-forming)
MGGASHVDAPALAAWDADETLRFADSPRFRSWSRLVSGLAVVLYAGYLVYRVLFTINPDALVFSVAVYLAEVHGFIAFLLYVFQLWSIRSRLVPPPAKGLRVDVFITTYNEDVALVRQTARAAIRMRYPHRTFILDDGRRPEIQDLARELGCNYLTRPTNEHAKAGNWNHAFVRTDAEFIATFDADHVPRSTFLLRTLGFFADPRVAYVQVPQEYHNFDSIQHSVDWNRRRLHSEQSAFFDLIMPGKDRCNAAYFCGTGAVLRRTALVPHGGILTGTVTEDLHTSIVLHSEGWKSVYVHENLVTGLATMDLKSYATQRLRWAEGNLKVMAQINPITCPGLSLPQRLNYFGSLFHWTTGLQKVVFYVAPAWMLMSGSFPIAHFDTRFLVVYLSFLSSLIISYKVLTRGRGQLLMDELYNMVSFFTLLTAMARAFVFSRTEGVFRVTEKFGSHSVAYKEALPHMTLVGFTVAALVWSALGLGFGIRDDAFGAGVAAFWALYNMALAVIAIRLALRPAQKRFAYRCRAHVAVTSASSDGSVILGVTSDVSEHGCRLLWPTPLVAGHRFTVRFHIGSHLLDRVAEVRFVDPKKSGEWFACGVQFVGQSQAQVDEFLDLIHVVVIPDLFGTLREESATTQGLRIAKTRLLRMFSAREQRRVLVVPVRVTTPDATFLSITTDISRTGVGVISPRPLAVGTTVTAHVGSAGGQWSMHTKVVRSVPRADHEMLGTWHVGLALLEGQMSEGLERLDVASAA